MLLQTPSLGRAHIGADLPTIIKRNRKELFVLLDASISNLAHTGNIEQVETTFAGTLKALFKMEAETEELASLIFERGQSFKNAVKFLTDKKHPDEKDLQGLEPEIAAAVRTLQLAPANFRDSKLVARDALVESGEKLKAMATEMREVSARAQGAAVLLEKKFDLFVTKRKIAACTGEIIVEQSKDGSDLHKLRRLSKELKSLRDRSDLTVAEHKHADKIHLEVIRLRTKLAELEFTHNDKSLKQIADVEAKFLVIQDEYRAANYRGARA